MNCARQRGKSRTRWTKRTSTSPARLPFNSTCNKISTSVGRATPKIANSNSTLSFSLIPRCNELCKDHTRTDKNPSSIQSRIPQLTQQSSSLRPSPSHSAAHSTTATKTPKSSILGETQPVCVQEKIIASQLRYFQQNKNFVFSFRRAGSPPRQPQRTPFN